MISNNKKMNGGGIFSKGKQSFKNVVKNTKKSESSLINAYEAMDKQANHYNKAYINHMDNIRILDDYVNFNGMETLFKKVIMHDNFDKGHIDKSNPLLFRNYIIEGEVLPSTFRREHLMNQIRYVMSKSIPGRDHSFIKYITITDINKDEFLLNTVTIDNIKQKKLIPHSDFLIDKDKTKKFIIDVVSGTMKKLKRSSIVAEFDDDDEVNYRKKRSDSQKSRSEESKKTYLNIIKNGSKSSKSSKSKSKSKKQSESKYKITHAKNSKSNTKKSNKLLRKERLSEYLDPFERQQRSQKRKIEAQQKQEGMQKGFEDKKEMILGGPQTGITPLQGVAGQTGQTGQPAQQIDPLDAKCKAFGSDKALCDANKECYFTPYNQCIKSKFQNPRPAFGNPPPTLGDNRQQNPFTIPQQQPQALF
jgi:hypothetical protein